MRVVRFGAWALAVAVLVSPSVASADATTDKATGLVSQMTLEEELSLVGSGIDGVPRLGVPPLLFTDGPNGVGEGAKGVTSWPNAINLGASFDPALAGRYGTALGTEAAGKGKTVIGAPTVNLLRSPLWGRAAETFSEDPFLTSRLAVSEIKGIQRQRIVAQVKHYAANNQEIGRFGTTLLAPGVDARIDPRTLNEVYYAAFRAAVGEGGAGSVMCSYNRLNGEQACESAAHLAALRTFGFRGFVEPDATLAVRDVVKAAKAGVQNFQLGSIASAASGAIGGQGRAETKILTDAVAGGALSRSVIDDAARDVLVGMDRVGLLDGAPLKHESSASTDAHRRLATTISARSSVLLKNARRVLPLSAKARSIAVIGADASGAFQTQEGGSPAVLPGRKVITPLAGIKARAPRHTKVRYERGSTGTVALPVVPAKALGGGLAGEYFASKDLSGAPVETKTVPTIDFASEYAPLKTIPDTTANSARWTGTLTPPKTGDHVFSLQGAGRSTLTIDGKRVASMNTEFKDAARIAPGAPPLAAMGTIRLRKGRTVKLALDYSNALSIGGSNLHLGWQPPNDRIDRAVRAARRSEVAVVFANDNTSEGMDRDSLALPGDQDSLITAVAKANPRTIVVLNTSGPVLMPWRNRVAGIVENWYPGQMGGRAIAQILFGDVNPSGHLPMTWPRSGAQGATGGKGVYPGDSVTSTYAEGLLIGYRWYDAKGQKPLYPFGYGGSYTAFRLGRAKVTGGDAITVRVPVRNTGKRSGAEVVQAYVTYPTGLGEPRQLKGFARLEVAPGRTRTATITIPRSELGIYESADKPYTIPAGGYKVSVGTSSMDLSSPIAVAVR